MKVLALSESVKHHCIMTKTLRQWREEKGMSQRAFATLAKVPQALVSKTENGLRAPVAEGIRMSDATDNEVHVQSLVGFEASHAAMMLCATHERCAARLNEGAKRVKKGGGK